MNKQARIIYSGMVQGVGFRYTARSIARESGVKGWVKNLASGEVEVLAQGSQEQVELFNSKIKDNFSSYIRDVNLNWEPVSKEYADFGIEF